MPNRPTRTEDEVYQPRTVTEQLVNYLRMASPQQRRSEESQEVPEKPRTRFTLDNEGLGLDEGNDLA